MYTSTKRILNSHPAPPTTPDEFNVDPTQTPGAGSSKAPWMDVRLGVLNRDSIRDVGITSLIAGGASGAVVCVGSAPFELVKVSYDGLVCLTCRLT
jgi:solute carrier family 25 carnitine/acylcarnitine transporter 20/29